VQLFEAKQGGLIGTVKGVAKIYKMRGLRQIFGSRL